MTTTVKVLIEGNKACEVYVSNGDGKEPEQPKTVQPGSFATMGIHGEKYVVVKEIGDFVN